MYIYIPGYWLLIIICDRRVLSRRLAVISYRIIFAVQSLTKIPSFNKNLLSARHGKNCVIQGVSF